MSLESKLVGAAMFGILSISSPSYADEATVMQQEKAIRSKTILQWRREHPEGVEGFIPSYEWNPQELFTAHEHFIDPALIEEVRSNTSLSESEKNIILVYAHKINKLYKESEDKETKIYQEIAGIVQGELTKEQYGKIVKDHIPSEKIFSLFTSQENLYGYLIELFEFVRNTETYKNRLTDQEKKDFYHSIHEGIDDEEKLLGYFKTQLELTLHTKKFWQRIYQEKLSEEESTIK